MSTHVEVRYRSTYSAFDVPDMAKGTFLDIVYLGARLGGRQGIGQKTGCHEEYGVLHLQGPNGLDMIVWLEPTEVK